MLLPGSIQEKILNGIKNTDVFGLAMSNGLGSNFASLYIAIQDRILTIAEEKPEVSNELVYGGIGNNFDHLQLKIQKRILEMVENNRESAYSFDYSIRDILPSVVSNEDIGNTIRQMASRIKDFRKGLGQAGSSL